MSKNYTKSKKRILVWLLPIGWMVLIHALSNLPASELPAWDWKYADKLAHVFLFAVLTMLLYLALITTFSKPALTLMLLSAGISCLYGATDEFHQLFSDGRSSDMLDWVADSVGAFISLPAIIIGQSWAKKKK